MAGEGAADALGGGQLVTMRMDGSDWALLIASVLSALSALFDNPLEMKSVRMWESSSIGGMASKPLSVRFQP